MYNKYIFLTFILFGTHILCFELDMDDTNEEKSAISHLLILVYTLYCAHELVYGLYDCLLLLGVVW